MSLATDVQEQIRRFTVGLVGADDLSDWLDAHAQQIHDTGDRRLRGLTDLTFSLLEDVFQGVRTSEDAREVLERQVSATMSVTSAVVADCGTLAEPPVMTPVNQQADFEPTWSPTTATQTYAH